MDEPRFCCAEMAVSFEQRQIYPSMDEDSGWNVRIDSFTDALTNIRYCPFCGNLLPSDKNWRE
jgi:hypothetical protein